MHLFQPISLYLMVIICFTISGCTEEPSDDAQYFPGKYGGTGLRITETYQINNYRNTIDIDSVYLGIDTTSIPYVEVLLTNDHFRGPNAYGSYHVNSDNIYFRLLEDYCPSTADCITIFVIGNWKYTFDGQKLVLEKEGGWGISPLPFKVSSPDTVRASKSKVIYELLKQ